MDRFLMGMSEEVLSCAEEDCIESAGFRAPVIKRADGEIVYARFCKVHARERNGRWNYFADMNADEIEHFRHQSYSWHKPTTGGFSRNPLHAALYSTDFLSDDVLFAASGIANHPKAHIPAEIRQALQQMQFDDVPDQATLKAQFRRLVKRYHPDVQPENARNLERLQNINAAYKTLKEYLHQQKNVRRQYVPE